MKSSGQRNYEAYCESRGWKNHAGESLPSWDQVRVDIQQSWQSAADAIVAHTLECIRVVQGGM